MNIEFKSGMFAQCCLCKKFRLEDGTYELRVVDPAVKVTHGYCPVCLAIMMAEIKAGSK